MNIIELNHFQWRELMRLISAIILLSILVVIIGCGGGPAPRPGTGSVPLVSVPDYYTNPPQDPNFLYARATAMSRDMQLAVDKAKQQARAEIESQLELKVNGLTKRFAEELGADEDSVLLSEFTQVSDSVVSTVMIGTRENKKDIVVENGIYRAYVLMELPLGEANLALMKQIKNNQNVYSRFKAGQAYDELEQAVEKYEQFKKEQGMAR